jgi:hypothetical protein
LKTFTTKDIPESKRRAERKKRQPVVVMKKLDLRNAERGIYITYIYIHCLI